MSKVNKPNLTITIVNGEFDDNNEDNEDGGLDPYAVLTLGLQKYETQVATNHGRSPKWNESFNFDYNGSKNVMMTLDVWERDPRAPKPVLIGTNKIDIYEILNSSDWERDVDISRQGAKIGVVLISFDFIGKSPKKSQSSPQVQAFSPSDKKVGRIQLIKPQPAPKIQFSSCDYEGQIEDMNLRVQQIENDQSERQTNVISYLQSNVQQAIQVGLEILSIERPENQIQFMGEFLLYYQE